jgi:hypothetical protein
MSPLIREYAGYVPFSPVDYVWIDFASAPIPSREESERMTEGLRALPYGRTTPIKDWPLPFERMCLLIPTRVEGTDDKASAVMVTTLDRMDDDKIFFQLWTNADKDHGSIVVRAETVLDHDDTRIWVSPTYLKMVKESEEAAAKHGAEVFKVAWRRLMAMVCLGAPTGGVARCTADAAVNAKRLKKGKRPFFEWTTVEVKPRAAVSESAGGTHASPKPHIRRGHVRRYKSGKVVAIKSSIVNKHKMPEEGFIFHDYVVESPAVH